MNGHKKNQLFSWKILHAIAASFLFQGLYLLNSKRVLHKSQAGITLITNKSERLILLSWNNLTTPSL